MASINDCQKNRNVNQAYLRKNLNQENVFKKLLYPTHEEHPR
jgi:hypothetical protein